MNVYREVKFNECSNRYPELLCEQGLIVILVDTQSKWEDIDEIPQEFMLKYNDIEVDLMEALIDEYTKTVDHWHPDSGHYTTSELALYGIRHKEKEWFVELVSELEKLLDDYKDYISVEARNKVVAIVKDYNFNAEDFFDCEYYNRYESLDFD